jgi:hypothetical protein
MDDYEAFLKWYEQKKAEEIEKVLTSCQFVHQKCHTKCSGAEPGPRTYYFFAFLY